MVARRGKWPEKRLDAGVEGDRVWMACTCGAVIHRDADRD
jgi:hypothetical protein